MPCVMVLFVCSGVRWRCYHIYLKEVSNHGSSESCWLVISGTVFDVTAFLMEVLC